ncbi:MAG TPA: succinate dehydrogenase [Casimicrobiaceae bacterium]|nr:succinate dehydrogenase [Casimicrobiaceae bacterium]
MEARVRAAPAVGHGERVEGVRFAAWLFVLQRASAAVLALCVLVHLATILYAVRHGLSAQAIVTRMHASAAWPAFYAVFVVAVGVHAPIGLRAVVGEWLGLRGPLVDALLALVAAGLLVGGLYAVFSLAF